MLTLDEDVFRVVAKGGVKIPWCKITVKLVRGKNNMVSNLVY